MKTTDIATFDLDVSNGLTLVQFGASWCQPCKRLKPILEELDQEESDVNLYYVDVDLSPELSSRYGIMSVPNVLLFQDGNLVNSIVGFNPKKKYVDLIQQYK